jgi:LmbE family N-acetylglucosaminyl deacetylase
LDTLPKLELVQAIERHIGDVRPALVYAHHWGDVNADHRAVSAAVLVACRPVGDWFPQKVHCFETPSSTEWGPPDPASQFVPTRFVDISETIDRKLEAMACYETELRPAPHPRSLEALRSRAAYWGQIVGRRYAEPFVVVREVA